jgi:hypothetical protein
MPKIKIKDLPKDLKLSKKEMKQVLGGISSRYKSTVMLPKLYDSDDDGCEPEVEMYFPPSEGGSGC